MQDVTEVRLVMDRTGGELKLESVPAVQLGPNRYRLLSSPGFAPGAAAGDEIELAAEELTGFRVLKRSGNVCLQLFFTDLKPGDRGAIAELFGTIGGWLDGGADGPSSHLLIFNVHISVADFASMERIVREVGERYALDEWMYGNVYDVRDGVTPLNWWADLDLHRNGEIVAFDPKHVWHVPDDANEH